MGLLSSVRTADGIFDLCGSTRIIRDLKIRGRDKLRRLPEVNFHNEACAHEAQTRVLAVLVSSRTRFQPAVVSKTWVFLGLFLRTIRRNRFPFQICWPWCFLRSYFSRFLSEIFQNEGKKGHKLCPLFVAGVLRSRPWMLVLSAQWRKVNHFKWS